MRPRAPELAAAAICGAAEMLPVSSSAHAALLGAGEDDVALHAGPLAALVIGRAGEAMEILKRLDGQRIALHLLASGMPSAVGLVVHRHRPHGRRAVAAGLLAGAGLLAAAGRSAGERTRWDAGARDGLWLGLAQTAALWPGISRNGATLAVARLRGFAQPEANALSREVGVPVTLGAVVLGGRPRPDTLAVSAAAAAVALPLLDVVDRGPLWPWAAYRAGLALLLLRESAAQ